MASGDVVTVMEKIIISLKVACSGSEGIPIDNIVACFHPSKEAEIRLFVQAKLDTNVWRRRGTGNVYKPRRGVLNDIQNIMSAGMNGRHYSVNGSRG